MIHDLSDSSAAPVSFGPFRVLHQIGVGVLGPVYRAQDSVREQLVAVKVFKVDAPPEQAEDIADALQAVAHTLPRHRGLLEYIAAGVERSTPYLVMTHSDVPSLDTKLKPGVPLDAEEALDLIATLADAIDAAHAKGILHGTMHPRDVFVDDRGGCRVSGFGVATTLAAQGIRVVPVRRPYSPPERVVGSPIEKSADLFALGALAFELFSGRRVVGVGLDAAVRCQVSAPDVDVEHLRTALAAMLAENPVHRPSTATAFAQAVTQAVRPRGLTAATARKRVTPQDVKPAALAAGAGAGAGAFSLTPQQSESTADTQPIPASTAQDASPDALALFTRQGTLWEPTRQSADADGDDAPLETVSIAPDEDPLAQFSSESDKPAAQPSASFTTPETEPIPALVETRIIPAPTEMIREPLEPADAEAAAAPTVRIRIDDSSSDDDVASIADAARHLARLRERNGTAAADAAAADAAAAAADADEDARQADATQPVEPELLRSVPRETVTREPGTREPAAREQERVDTEVHAPLAASAVAGWAASASSVAASTTSHATDAEERHDQLRDRTHEHVLGGPHDWAAAEEPEESGSNPLRLLFIVLAIGLAVGVAGGYLLGQRSALRQAFAIFSGGSSNSSSSEQAAATGSPSPSAPATTPATEVSEPTVIPEGTAPAPSRGGSAPPRTEPRAGRNDAARTPGSRPAAAAPSAAAGESAREATPTTARLLVRSAPARAEVTVNGVKRGETPVTLRDLPFGTHTIRVARAGYVASTRKVTLSASRASETVEFALEPERPARAANAPGSRTSGPNAAGAAGARTPGVVAAGGDANPDRASAEATAAGLGALWVLSHPAGARVIVDGQYLGNTPLMTNVPPGDKTVKLELPGHKGWAASVHVNAGQRLRVAASLEEGTQP